MDDRQPHRARPAGLIDWVFLDVGNVLYNDDRRTSGLPLRLRRPGQPPPRLHVRRHAGRARTAGQHGGRLHPHPDRTSPSCHHRGKPRQFSNHSAAFLIETYDRHNLLNAGAFDVLRGLRATWRLGDHHQPAPRVRQEHRAARPARLFRCRGHQRRSRAAQPVCVFTNGPSRRPAANRRGAVMVGDRRDNDIAPAKTAGMRGDSNQCGPSCRSRGWSPDDVLAESFLDSCDAIPLFPQSPSARNPTRWWRRSPNCRGRSARWTKRREPDGSLIVITSRRVYSAGGDRRDKPGGS